MTARHLALVGMMGVGKSTVGREVARRLGRVFVDLDTAIEKTADATIPEIFETEGEAAFRSQERAALVEACASSEMSVIACGGGVVIQPANRETLRDGAIVIWLRAEASVIAQRVVATSRDRPLLTSGSSIVTALDGLMDARREAYSAAADHVIETDTLTATAVADRVIESFERESA